MGRCSCGASILSKVGQGFITTPERGIVWLRRRTDNYSCPDCGRMYDMGDLKAMLAGRAEVSNEPPDQAPTSPN